MTEGGTFVDTNILVYAHDASEPHKHAVARARLEDLWASRSGLLSTQVLQEFYAIATSFQKLAMGPAEAREVMELYGSWSTVSMPCGMPSAR